VKVAHHLELRTIVDPGRYGGSMNTGQRSNFVTGLHWVFVREVPAMLLQHLASRIRRLERVPPLSIGSTSTMDLSSVSSPTQRRHLSVRLGIPLFAVLLASGAVICSAVYWNRWTGDAALQVTDDSFVSADVTHLSCRINGQISNVRVTDFQVVKRGDILVEIDPSEYQAQVDLVSATVAASQASLEELSDQIKLQYDTITRAEASLASSQAIATETREEQDRQNVLAQTDAGTQQRLQQATAAYSKAKADVDASTAMVAAQHRQLDILRVTRRQREAELAAAKASQTAAALKLGYTTVRAPFDGVVSQRQVQTGDYVNAGSNLIDVVPIPEVYVIANYKETQLTNVSPGQAVDIMVDTFPGRPVRGRVERISPASGSQFALLPPDNATGNFTKVVQRIAVRIAFETGQSLVAHLLPGMSVITKIHTKSGSDGDH
jgi:membrane fusion protein, multidrug efflux system